MMDLQLPKNTLFGLKGNRSRYSLESLPPAVHISFKPEMIGQQFGWVKVISAEKRWNASWNHCYVLTQCIGCGAIQWQLLSNLQRGKSKGCQSCSQPRQIPLWLEKRLTAAKQRCENPQDKGYHNYGARGIKFEFSSVTEAGLYLIKKYGLPKRELEIDRIDNNGSYARDNIRFVTHTENNSNKRCTVLSRFSQKYWPYVRSVVIRKLSDGLSRKEIIQDAETAVFEKRKNWRLIQARLEFMTYEMLEDIIVFTVSGKLVHNCGYGGSVGALKNMGAVEMGVQENELQGLINDWRNANPHIVRFWYEVGNAAMKAIKEKTTVPLGKLVFAYERGILFIRLPNGRRLSYIKPRIGTNRFGGDSITYMGINSAKKWDRLETFGGKLTENIVQGTARDLLANALINAANAGYDTVFHVHDEIICEVPNGYGSVDELCKLMCIKPEWADGLPLNADGFECEYYKKE